jgi:cytochrome c-type biogenesis protein CcmH
MNHRIALAGGNRRIALALLAAAALATVLAPAAAAGASAPHPRARTSLTAIWNEVMCPSCHEPLSVAQSPQAVEERQFIQRLVVEGDTKAQIERILVDNYGPSVLGRPPAHGFNLTVYILPPALLVAGIAFLAFSLPRWRARTRSQEPMATPQPAPSADDAQRLDEDLARFR